MQIIRYVVGPVQTNCYFLINEETREMLCVDPGDYGIELAEAAREEELKPLAVLLTHGHFDHASGAKAFAEEFQIPVLIHEEDKETLEDPKMNASWMIGQSKSFQADRYLKDEEILSFGSMECKVLSTPGHTKGGCCYFFETEKLLISGDTLLYHSRGRSDLPGGNDQILINSIRSKLMVLPEDTKVLPGHGEATMIKNEKMFY